MSQYKTVDADTKAKIEVINAQLKMQMMRNLAERTKPKFDPEWRRQYEIAREAAAFDRMVTYT